MKMSIVNKPDKTVNADRPIHGACRLSLPWRTRSPNDGYSCDKPSPKKSNAVKEIEQAIDAKIKWIICPTERIPVHDILKIKDM